MILFATVIPLLPITCMSLCTELLLDHRADEILYL